MSHPVVSTNTEDVAGASNRSSQTKLLQLRKARFRGAAIPSPNTTPAPRSSDSKSSSNGQTSTLLDEEQSPLTQMKERSSRPASGDLGILQEISNSSMRRKRRSVSLTEPDSSNIGRASSHEYRLTSVQESALLSQSLDPSPPQQPGANPKKRERRLSQSKAAPDTQGSKSSSIRNRRSAGSRRSLTGDFSAGYIEHLEHQIGLLETQVQSLTSPGRVKAQSMKLRALSSEAKLLRQEVAEWESKFEERVSEQLEQQETLTGSLRAQVRAMKKVAETTDAELEVLRADNAAKTGQLESTELLNLDLERRLEMMSELVASSPTKARFGDDIWNDYQRRTPKQAVRRPPVSPSRRLETSNAYSSLQSPPLVAQSAVASPSAIQELDDQSMRGASQSNFESELSESTLVDDSSVSPSRRRWTTQLSQNGSEVKPRSSRRMRRFFGSCAGPRALILPSTAYPNSYVSSTPTSAVHTPSISAENSESIRREANLHSKLPDPVETAGWMAPSSSDVTPVDEDAPIENFERVAFSPLDCPSLEPTPMADGDNATPPGNHVATLKRESILPNHNTTLFQELAELEESSDSEEYTLNPKSPDPEEDSPPASPDSVKSVISNQQRSSNIAYESGATMQSPLMSRTLPLPLRIINHLANATSRTLESKSPRVKMMMTNAWSMITLSRPVLEFRWWLVKLLIGDMHRRSHMLQPFEVGLGPKPPPDPGETWTVNWPKARDLSPWSKATRKRKPTPNELTPNIWDVFKTRERYKHATPPPVSWLKFSITLVFAVGIAIKDGPASLFKTRDEPDAVYGYSHEHEH